MVLHRGAHAPKVLCFDVVVSAQGRETEQAEPFHIETTRQVEISRAPRSVALAALAR
eukprot:CAMPEP_0115405142 /NCGR_PEP_ID=MMETSP0271-20121206/17779_1 /TAXON_ID=71861 /ORGANISM="Scrippsiella trochoidea, Strain CCMP3099" /LENGTH=56 /DNA_ID=CAMNT_0002829135 /DNA_START=776 /DNA_END=946 /DNA_ORIENTATION=-